MGAGKTTVGRRLSQRIGWEFVDTDSLVEKNCGTSVNVIFEVEGEKGAWGHALGGMGSITQIMKSVCEKMGVEITTNASVNKILVQNNSATGVLLEDGSKILSKKVISNLNPKLLFKNLVNHDDVDKEYLRKILRYKCGSGTFRMNVALSELPNFKCLPSSSTAWRKNS